MCLFPVGAVGACSCGCIHSAAFSQVAMTKTPSIMKVDKDNHMWLSRVKYRVQRAVKNSR